MSRIRTIKPEFAQDQRVGSVSREARLCWLMLWTVSDDAGRFRAHPVLVASSCFPYDGVAEPVVRGWLAELAAAKLVTLYRVDGQEYGCHINWNKHQKIDHATASKLPAPEAGEITELDIPEVSESFARISEDFAGEGKGREGKGVDIVAKATHPSLSVVELGSRGDVQAVFQAWRDVTGHKRAVLDSKRRSRIASALTLFGRQFLVEAAVGWKNDEFCQGANESGKVYDAVDLVFRDAEHIERFHELFLHPEQGKRRGARDRELAARLAGSTRESLGVVFPNTFDDAEAVN